MTSVDLSLSKQFAELTITDTPAPYILYGGTGAAPHSVKAIQIIVSTILRLPIQIVTEKFFQNEEFFQNAAKIRTIRLIIFPGGISTSKIEEALESVGLENLYTAICVFKVAFLGICAGTNLTSKEMRFHDEPFRRKFRFCAYPDIFKGIAHTPVPATVDKVSECTRKISLICSQEIVEGYVVNMHSPWFDIQDASGVKVLAYYNTNKSVPLDAQPPAIIHCTENGTNGVLCAPHAEILLDLPTSPVFADLIFQTMLKALGFLPKDLSWNAFFKGFGLKQRQIRSITDCPAIEKFYSLSTAPISLLTPTVEMRSPQF